MLIDFGKELVSCEDDPHLERWLAHMKRNMSYEERTELFREARRDGEAHFSPKLGVHLRLQRKPDGTYTLSKTSS